MGDNVFERAGKAADESLDKMEQKRQTDELKKSLKKEKKD